MNDFQTVDSELKLCQDSIKFLQMKKELLTKEVLENANLLHVLHSAMNI